MKINAVHHVAIIVSDYEKSKDFYVKIDTLGNNLELKQFGIIIGRSEP